MNSNPTALDFPETRQEPIGRSMESTTTTNGNHEPLFPGSEMDSFRGRWQSIQGEFVDDPRHAVEEADQLVSNMVSRLSEVFGTQRQKMEGEWSKGEDVSTEDLRQALRRYRTFFDRLLAA
jgi:hypothetical protein